MQLMVLHEPDGTDSVFGMVWPWFQAMGSLPQCRSTGTCRWRLSHALGSPSLDGGLRRCNRPVQQRSGDGSDDLGVAPDQHGDRAHGSVTGRIDRGPSFHYGPWQITGNTYNGAVAGTFVGAAFTFYTGHSRTSPATR